MKNMNRKGPAAFACRIGVLVIAISGIAQAEQDVLIEGPAVTVTVDDFNAALERVPEGKRDGFRASQQRVVKSVEGIYIVQAAAADARSKGLDKDQRVQDLIRHSTNNILASEMFRHAIESAPAPDFDKAADERYRTNPDLYMLPERRRASHILIKPDGRSDAEALELAGELLVRIQKGENFEDLARQYSGDTGSAGNGGQLSPFQKGKMVKPFEEAAWALQKPGDISQPVKSRFGYHIIRLDEVIEAAPLPFASVEPRIIDQLRKEYSETIKGDYITRLLSDPGIKINKDAINSLIIQIEQPANVK